jgi:hypothetical protein
VVDEFGDDELEALLGAGGVRGVDGELKNLISPRMDRSHGS